MTELCKIHTRASWDPESLRREHSGLWGRLGKDRYQVASGGNWSVLVKGGDVMAQ